jgi:solute carrier family 36 (proton-coupled amino acid transporter)
MPTPPTKPLNIGSPRSGDLSGADAGSAGIPGTPPVPNIPRYGSPRATPVFLGDSPGRAGTPGSFMGGAGRTGTPGSLTVGGGLGAARASGAGTPMGDAAGVNVDELTDEEKARVLRRHLMSREEREAAAAQSGPASRRGSDVSAVPKSRRPSAVVRRQDTEAFPVPFQAPGADVTYCPSPSPPRLRSAHPTLQA